MQTEMNQNQKPKPGPKTTHGQNDTTDLKEEVAREAIGLVRPAAMALQSGEADEHQVQAQEQPLHVCTEAEGERMKITFEVVRVSEVPTYTVTPQMQARMDADKAINALSQLTELGLIVWHTVPFADARWQESSQTGIAAHGHIQLTMLDIDGEEGFCLVNPVYIRAKELCDSPALYHLAKLVFKNSNLKCCSYVGERRSPKDAGQ